MAMNKLTAILPGLLLVAGCAVGPDYKRPDLSVDKSFANARDRKSVV